MNLDNLMILGLMSLALIQGLKMNLPTIREAMATELRSAMNSAMSQPNSAQNQPTSAAPLAPGLVAPPPPVPGR